MVMRAIDRAVKDLLSTETGGGGGATMPVEKLARTQALFLFQIIRLLDGDVTLRAQGERDIRLLEVWLNDLCKVRENLRDLGAGSGTSERNSVGRRNQHPPQWETWIFAESVRRTIIMAHSFLQLYEMMKGLGSGSSNSSEAEDDDRGVWDYTHRWTLSRHLWEAKSSFEFERAWKEKPHFIITNYAFNHFLQNGRGDDVDELAEILLSVYMGVEETKEFITAKS
ncbi:hypothetical protein H2204_011595 [Knufia peltigerae]|nr:hypothetical protein H2204_011595 [Knufia peltigerae]